MEPPIRKISLSDSSEKRASRDIVRGGEATRGVVERASWKILVARKVICRKNEDDEVKEDEGNTKSSLLNVHGNKTLPGKIDHCKL